MSRTFIYFLLALLPALVRALGATDEIQDADPAQSGYLDNHNMHPATVGSSIFGILWKNTYGAKEKWYAKPLVYTPLGGAKTQLVFLASSMNVIRTLDAVNGTLLNQRTVQPPFLQSDIGCTDIPDYIGIIGTPIIDPATDTVYFFSKGYVNGASNGGVANGIYKFYAVDINTLNDKPGFPILIDGHNADNDPTRYFIGGTVLQRPSLTLINGAVIGGFGGHCDLFNYTGMLVSVSTTPNVGVLSMFAMESSPGAPTPQPLDIQNQNGGKAGIWQAGMGLATDKSRFFLATGNGQGHANGDVAASGRTPLSTLDEVVANMGVSSAGKITLTDYFEPHEYVSMDAGDRDLGSGGVALLDPTTFSGTGVGRIAVTIGKNAKAYIMNANNLGGFKQGSGGSDNIVQTITACGSVFGGAGSYPLESGYIYFTPVGCPTVAYKFGLDNQGAPLFALAGTSKANGAGRVGIGPPTVTTYKGQAGTGIVWIADPNAGLVAYNAVPSLTGELTPIPLPPTGGLNKFQRPAFGDGRLYVSDNNGNVICMGSPVALALSCSQPVAFGDVAIGSTSTQIVNCTANIDITSVNGCTTSDGTFQCANSSLPHGFVAKGTPFTFPVTWNLTQASINDAQNASFGKVSPGIASASLNIYTTNAVPKYSNLLPISLSGTTVSKSAFLSISPPEVDLGGIVVGSPAASSGVTAAVTIANIGAQPMTFTGMAWTDSVDIGDGPIVYTNITDGDLGDGFSSTNLPAIPSTLASGASLSIPIKFIAASTGAFSTFVQFWTTGGTGYVLLTGSASTAPIANISISTVEGGWDYSEPVIMDFGTVAAGITVTKNIQICNQGGSALTITKSKPPVQPELLAPNAGVDLHEAQTIDVNSCALGAVSIVAAPLGVNRLDHTVSDVWILNTDDTTFGVHDVQITANIKTRQLGPLLANGSAEYLYLGCYYDGGGRQLSKMFNIGSTNENGICLQTCFNAGYKFAATEYHTECWCGNTAPSAAKFTADSLKKCAFSCPGDTSQACGGTGTYMSLYYDRTKYVPGPDSIPGSSSSSSSSIASTSTVSTPTGTVSTGTTSGISTSTNTASTGSSTGTVSTGTTSGSSTGVASVTSTSTSSSSTSTSTVPAIVQSAGGFTYLGCYTEATTGRALSAKTLATDAMNIELCASTCAGYTYFGVEYHRECYCGNSLAAGSNVTTSGCTMLCTGNNLEYCGGSKRLQMYISSGSASTSVASTSSSSLSTTSDSAPTTTVVTSSTSLSATDSVSSTSSSTSSSSTSASTSSSSLSTTSDSAPTTTVVTSSTSSTDSLSSASSSSSSVQTSTSASTTSSSNSVPSTTSTTSSPTSSPPTTLMTATTTSASVTATLGFTSMGCFGDPAGGPFAGHNMPKLFSNDSMTPELCISSALARLSAKPATTYAYVGVEYGRECYAGIVAPTPEPASLTGIRACTIPCKGDAVKKCGGANQYNLYAATTATISGTGTTVWNSAPAVSTV
ncbi:hypothetical protein BP6252_04631 [Coleophoma cylindrospora]|uniref:WSC domain-containing protein n=1 Tax=Coleophoma cylindrospora TaxID=1849047 RepID=A0A3D8S104_9HELO|nr:hypothetical protein BP6252_04631 [Coleophoma cylindrospora]